MKSLYIQHEGEIRKYVISNNLFPGKEAWDKQPF